ncbi:hypothetical protein R5H32_02090 [Defluviimonas sp. D31]|uniref:hypothetical protein n=1 Tax=Defluviimonas sp. D31 TaxID=3083253 RepID=UPI00296E78CD|nr:hypothetical protein [Defluviimonas sp. D31]MDW4548136.1 hypothetical protein [Defluviimonas sp. D31]
MHLALALLAAHIFPAGPVSADICVTNADRTRLLFVAETDSGTRVIAWLDPSGRLCAEGAGAGRVSVYEAEDSLEGCTRLVPPDGADVLLRYTAFDRCLWQSHLD